MATYNAPNYTYNYPMPYHGQANNIQCLLDATVTLSAAPTTADTINFGYLPPNAVVTGAISIPSDMDTGGSPSLTLDLGTVATAQLFFAAATGGQTGTASNGIAAAGIGYKTTAKTLVVGTAHANAATGAAGTWQVLIFGYIKDATTSG
jgi:hypothetical protein